MRVALVCPYDLGRPGGVQDQVVRLATWIRDRGHEAEIVGAGTVSPVAARLLGSATVIPGNRSAVPIAIDPRIGVRLREAVSGCDVVHLHEPLMPVIGPAALRLDAPPIVATFHADPPRWARWGYSLGRGPLRSLLSRVAVATAVSRVAAAPLAGLVPVRIVPNAIETAEYAPRGAKTQGRVLFVGRDDPRKGLDVLLAAWPAIRDAVPEATLRLVGADRGEPPEGVEYLGRVDEAAKRSELAAAEVLVAPNTGGESFGIILLEGMAAGCAVVASAIPAFAGVLADAGVLTAAGDQAGIARAVASLLHDGDRRRNLQNAALRRAVMFDAESVTDTYLAAYREAARIDV